MDGKVTVHLHHRLKWFIHLWAHGLRREISTPALRRMAHFTKPYLSKGGSVAEWLVVTVLGKLLTPTVPLFTKQ